MKIADKVIVVTGGAAGIGESIKFTLGHIGQVLGWAAISAMAACAFSAAPSS